MLNNQFFLAINIAFRLGPDYFNKYSFYSINYTTVLSSSLLDHSILKMMITVLSNNADILQYILLRRIDSGLPHRFATQMLTGKLSERTVPSRVHYQGLRSVVRDKFLVIKRNGFVAALATRGVVSSEDPLERLPELRVEDGVDDWVEGGVRVAQPGEDLEGDVRDASLAESGDYVYAEEGYPADEEYAHNYTLKEKTILLFVSILQK